jgi:hypothetical protein
VPEQVADLGERDALLDEPFLTHTELAASDYATSLRERDPKDGTIRRVSLNPNDDILPGWRLTLDAGDNGYWFIIQDTTDPCGFAFISNQRGQIFSAKPIR